MFYLMQNHISLEKDCEMKGRQVMGIFVPRCSQKYGTGKKIKGCPLFERFEEGELP